MLWPPASVGTEEATSRALRCPSSRSIATVGGRYGPSGPERIPVRSSATLASLPSGPDEARRSRLDGSRAPSIVRSSVARTGRSSPATNSSPSIAAADVRLVATAGEVELSCQGSSSPRSRSVRRRSARARMPPRWARSAPRVATRPGRRQPRWDPWWTDPEGTRALPRGTPLRSAVHGDAHATQRHAFDARVARLRDEPDQRDLPERYERTGCARA